MLSAYPGAQARGNGSSWTIPALLVAWARRGAATARHRPATVGDGTATARKPWENRALRREIIGFSYFGMEIAIHSAHSDPNKPLDPWLGAV